MHTGGGPRILVIEDDDAVREALASALEHEGYDVRAHPEGTDLLLMLQGFSPDLALLDVRLAQGPDGLALGRRIRADGDVPILYLTAADGVADRLAGFRAGADDYVTKPFAMAELLARIEALLRRAGRLTRSHFTFEDVEVRLDDRTATRGGVPLDLTRTELDLLVALLRANGKVLSKTQLLATVWDYEEYDPNLVEVHVSALRRKLERHGPRIVQTVRGFGYALRPA